MLPPKKNQPPKRKFPPKKPAQKKEPPLPTDLDGWLREIELIEAHEAKLRASVQYCPQTPTPKQKLFLDNPAFEVLYGGAAGGAKSSALLMGALQHIHVPGYSALILRRTYADLKRADSLIDRSRRWFAGTAARWNGTDHMWTFPSGATIEFGHCDNDTDVGKYLGSAWQYLAIDEVTQFEEQWYTQLCARVRRPAGSELPLRIRTASNPGGVGHDWVKKRFVEQDVKNPDCVYIPARLEDNPYLDQVSYRKSLALLDETTRLQMENGEWIQNASGLVFRFKDDTNVVDHIPTLTNYVLGIDYGTKSECAFVTLGYRENDPNVYVVASRAEKDLYPDTAAKIVKELEARYKFQKMVGDHDGMGAGFIAEARKRFQLPIQNADKNNRGGYVMLLGGAIERGALKVHRSCQGLIKELFALRWDKERKDVAPRQKDHETDACMYAWRQCPNYLAEPLNPEQEGRLAMQQEAIRFFPQADPNYQAPEWWDRQSRRDDF